VKKRSFLESFAAVPHSVWALLFIVAPLLFVAYFAFTDAYGNFTFDNITMLSSYAHIFVLSICFALIATAICLLIGYPLAFFISQLKPSTQKILIVLIMLPMWISLLIRTYSLMAILDNGGLLNSLLSMLGIPKVKIVGTAGAVILGMVYDFLPYMVLPIYTSISKLDKRYLEAAQDLGCNNVRTLFKVVFPLSVPGVISGITMVFVPSISTFYISQKLGGGSFDLIGDTIERQFQNVSTYNIGAAISLIMMILILISVAIMNKFSDDDEGGIIV
jgi:spermidine/putrescine transport system permease protein